MNSPSAIHSPIAEQPPTPRKAHAAYRSRGWWPIPIPAKTKAPKTPGWPAWRIEDGERFAAQAGAGNISLLLGPDVGGLADVDLDAPEAALLACQYLPPTECRWGRPGKPGSHWLYVCPDAGIAKRWAAPDGRCLVELRAESSEHRPMQSVCPPSVHVSGEPIRWEAFGEPGRPAWSELLDAVGRLAIALGCRAVERQDRPAAAQGSAGAPEIERARKYLDAMPPAVSGQGGHATAYRAAVAMVWGFRLSEAEALDLMLQAYNPRCDPPWSEREMAHKIHDAATKSHQEPYGWLADARMPADPPRPAQDHQRRPAARKEPSPPADAPTEVESINPYRGTDAANAEIFLATHAGACRYIPAWSSWMTWAGSHWQRDESLEIDRLAGAVPGRLREIADHMEGKQRAAVEELAERLESRRKQQSMLDTARCHVVTTHDQLNIDPMAINVANGTIDLETGELRQHRRDDMITYCLPINYSPDAQAPRWSRFLSEIFDGQEDVIAFIRRAAGYSLSARVNEDVLFLCHGDGHNGKSVFMDTLLAIAGKIGCAADSALLMDRQSEQHPTIMADLYGRRMVSIMETPKNGFFNESRVKWLTGGDRLRARRMREDFWEFQPTHKLWIATNHIPEIRGTDEGIWRRIRLIPFQVKFGEGGTKPSENKAELEATLLAEAPGILAWAVAGAVEWARDGLRAPKEVLSATLDMRQGSDVLGSWLAERCEIPERGKDRGEDDTSRDSSSNRLYRDYVSWCEDRGERAETAIRWARMLKQRGLDQCKNKKIDGKHWKFWLSQASMMDQK